MLPMPAWVDAAEAAGAISATLAFLGGAAVTTRYGRRANASVSAHAFDLGNEALIVIRPSISAIGVFRLRFSGAEGGAQIRVTEVCRSDRGLSDGRFWDLGAIFETEFVEAGETLTTSVVLTVDTPAGIVLGWRVSFGVQVERWPEIRGVAWAWADRTFLARGTMAPIALGVET